jgi:cell division protein FtsX
MGRIKLTDDAAGSAAATETVKYSDLGHHQKTAKVRYQRPEQSSREQRTILARLVAVITFANFVQYGLIAALISVAIVGFLSRHVH